MHLTIATWNSWKYVQITDALGWAVQATQRDLDLIEIQSNDMLAVSSHKARQAFDQVGSAVLVDDSGIFFAAYPDFPGVFSKYIYASLGITGLQKLFHEQQNTGAWYQCVLSYMDETLSEPIQFVGKSAGVIDFSFLDQVVVNPHLPFDAFFRPEGMAVVAGMDMNTFARQHHRGRAAQQLKEWLLHR
jgi:XTP/dITP diphosphohydrolase